MQAIPARAVGSQVTATLVRASLPRVKPTQISAVRPVRGSTMLVSAVLTAGASGSTAGAVSSSLRGAQ